MLLISIGSFGYEKYQSYSQRHEFLQSEPTSAIEESAAQSASSSIFHCDGRTHCSQMTSCAEATYFLQHCPGVKMDGNNDGVPCERQWCTSIFSR
ncbi:MAG: excalibur calcium-binding domain-containing protein [Burkholderiaceae bacterium]